MSIRLITGDCREVLRTLPDESVHCVVTSPPYFGLRDYGMAGQIGLEVTPDAYVAELVAVFREVRRVLRKDGTCWLNLGDSYSRDPGKPKDLIGIPWLVAFALQADGWWLRQDIIWSKLNPMPESVTDRCTKSHEYLFLLAKAERYYFDAAAIAEPVTGNAHSRGNGVNPKCIEPGLGIKQNRSFSGAINGLVSERNKRSVWHIATQPYSEAHFATFPPGLVEPCLLAGCPAKCCAKCGAPWVREVEREQIAGRPNSNSIRGSSPSSNQSGSPQRGCMYSRSETLGFSPSCACTADTVAGAVLDPFAGAGTVGLVADRLQRDAILIDLNGKYMAMGGERIRGDAPLFVEFT